VKNQEGAAMTATEDTYHGLPLSECYRVAWGAINQLIRRNARMPSWLLESQVNWCVAQSIAKFDPSRGSKFSTFIHNVTERKIWEVCRREYARRERLTEHQLCEFTDDMERMHSRELPPIEGLIAREERECAGVLPKIRRHLHERDFAWIVCWAVNGETLQEIAESEGMSRSRVGLILKQARNRAARVLEKELA
jgi:RNA polymerase sigma factor (sigma-70 family)